MVVYEQRPAQVWPRLSELLFQAGRQRAPNVRLHVQTATWTRDKELWVEGVQVHASWWRSVLEDTHMNCLSVNTVQDVGSRNDAQHSRSNTDLKKRK